MKQKEKPYIPPYIRQGDLLFIPIGDSKSHAAPAGFDRNKKGIIQEGEATGHHHRLETLDSGQVFRAGQNQWTMTRDAHVFIGESGATVVHEEHKPVALKPKTAYRVQVAKEYDYTEQEARMVRD